MTDEVLQRTADALNIARPTTFADVLADKRAAKMKVKSRFLPQSNATNSPEEVDWVEIEQSMSASPLNLRKDSDWPKQGRRLSSETFSCLKEQLNIVGPSGRSYISTPGIEQRLAFRAQGLNSTEDSHETQVSLSSRIHARSGKMKEY